MKMDMLIVVQELENKKNEWPMISSIWKTTYSFIEISNSGEGGFLIVERI